MTIILIVDLGGGPARIPIALDPGTTPPERSASVARLDRHKNQPQRAIADEIRRADVPVFQTELNRRVACPHVFPERLTAWEIGKAGVTGPASARRNALDLAGELVDVIAAPSARPRKPARTRHARRPRRRRGNAGRRSASALERATLSARPCPSPRRARRWSNLRSTAASARTQATRIDRSGPGSQGRALRA